MNMNNKSFTLIELLVVIVIIGILAGVIMISTSSSIDKASLAKVKVFEESLKNDLMINLLSEWKLDGNTNDSWGSSNGTLKEISYASACDTSHCPQVIQNCVSKDCYYFESNDYIEITDNQGLKIGTDDFTIAAWIKTNAAKEHGRNIVGRYNPGFLLRNQYGGIEFGVNNGTWQCTQWGVGSTNLDDNKWHYIIGMRDVRNNALKMFFDGVEKFNTAGNTITNISGDLTSNTKNWQIGSLSADWDYIGYIDEVKLYNAALSSSEIKQNYIAGLNSLLSSGTISKKEYDERVNNLAKK